MKIVTYQEYIAELLQFIKTHNGISKIETTSMENNQYEKTYMCEDGAAFYEVNGIVYEKAEVEVKGIKFEVKVKLFRIEYGSIDDPVSKYVYLKAD